MTAPVTRNGQPEANSADTADPSWELSDAAILGVTHLDEKEEIGVVQITGSLPGLQPLEGTRGVWRLWGGYLLTVARRGGATFLAKVPRVVWPDEQSCEQAERLLLWESSMLDELRLIEPRGAYADFVIERNVTNVVRARLTRSGCEYWVFEHPVPYLGLKYLSDFESLSVWISSRGLRESESAEEWWNDWVALGVCRQLAARTNWLHNRLFAHGDIRDANVMIRPSMLKEPDRDCDDVVLIDFASAHRPNEALADARPDHPTFAPFDLPLDLPLVGRLPRNEYEKALIRDARCVALLVISILVGQRVEGVAREPNLVQQRALEHLANLRKQAKGSQALHVVDLLESLVQCQEVLDPEPVGPQRPLGTLEDAFSRLWQGSEEPQPATAGKHDALSAQGTTVMPARGLSRPMFGFAMVIVMVLSVAILTDRTKDTTVPGGSTAKKEPTVPGRGTAKKDTTPTVTPVSGRYTVPGDTAPKLGSPKPNIPPSPVAAQFVYAPKAGVALSLVLPDSISSHAKCVRADLQVTFRHAESGVLLGEPLHVLCDETQALLLTDESLAEAQLPQDTCLKAEVGPANHRPLATGMIQLRSDNEYNKSRPRITACLPR